MDEAGGIDDDVEPAALLRQLRYPLGGRSFVEEINDKGLGPAARRPNFTRHPIQLLPITRAEVDSRPSRAIACATAEPIAPPPPKMAATLSLLASPFLSPD